jgi:ketosteroid isomerase-like protein
LSRGDARSESNVELVAELHRRQAAMYAGGDTAPVAELLDPGIVWHVPGTSPIAGEHRGREAVLDYFRRRRELARGTMRMHPRGWLAEGDAVVQLVDGSAELGGQSVRWHTVGVYRIRDGRVAEVWLVPLELDEFERIWGGSEAAGGAPAHG